jgi:hypothetical protein
MGGLMVSYILYTHLDAVSLPDGFGFWLFWALTALCVAEVVVNAISSNGDDLFFVAVFAIFLFGLIWNNPHWSAVGLGADIVMIAVLGTAMGIGATQHFKGDRLQGIETGIAILSGSVGIAVSANILRVIAALGWKPFVEFKDLATIDFLGGAHSHWLVNMFELALVALWDALWLYPGVVAACAASWTILCLARHSRRPS